MFINCNSYLHLSVLPFARLRTWYLQRRGCGRFPSEPTTSSIAALKNKQTIHQIASPTGKLLHTTRLLADRVAGEKPRNNRFKACWLTCAGVHCLPRCLQWLLLAIPPHLVQTKVGVGSSKTCTRTNRCPRPETMLCRTTGGMPVQSRLSHATWPIMHFSH